MTKARKSSDIKELRTRLKQGKLSTADKKHIDEMLGQFEKVLAKPVDAKGRVLIARLPFGMDIVK